MLDATYLLPYPQNVTMGNVTVTKCASAALSSCTARTIAVQPIGGSEVWAKPLSGGDVALVLYNKGEFPINITIDLADVMAFNNSVRLPVTYLSICPWSPWPISYRTYGDTERQNEV